MATPDLENLFWERTRELDQLCADPVINAEICPDSTPVLYFGALATARALTVGINPSSKEFLARDESPLVPQLRRFAHASDLVDTPIANAQHALARMNSYFSNEPDTAYMRWFSPVERLLTSFGCSLRDRTAAHTDIASCFASTPWAKLDAAVQAKLSASGFATFLQVAFAATQAASIVLLGPSAIDRFVHETRCDLSPITTPFDVMPKCKAWSPVLSVGRWELDINRFLRVIAVRPNWDLPTHPLTALEVDQLAPLVKQAGY